MKPYEPNNLPIDNLDFRRLITLVGQANAELARYDGLLQGIINPAVMLSPLTVEEAVLCFPAMFKLRKGRTSYECCVKSIYHKSVCV